VELAPAPLSHIVQNVTFFESLVTFNSVRAGGGGVRAWKHTLMTVGQARCRKAACDCGSTMSPSVPVWDRPPASHKY